MTKAGINLPCAGHAHAVTARAEIIRQWGNHAENTARLSDLYITRWPARFQWRVDEGELLRETIAHGRQRDILIHAVFINFAKWHDLN